MNTSKDQQKAIWLGGLPYTGDRPITDEERVLLRGIANRCRKRFLVALLASPAMFLTLLGLAAVFSPGDDQMWPFLIGALVSVLIAPAICLLIMRDAWRRRRGVLGDLREGVFLVFEQPGEEGGPPEVRVEVMPVSRMAWTVNGVRPAKWTPAIPSEVSEMPEYARAAAEWVEPVDPDDEMSPELNDRELSATELDELASHIRHSRWSMVPFLLLMNVIVAVVFFFSLREHKWPDGVAIYMLAVFVPVGDYHQVQAWLTASKLSRDLAVGRVIIVRVKLEEEEETTLSDAFEFLPVSNTPWTAAGLPATWRLTPAERRKRK